MIGFHGGTKWQSENIIERMFSPEFRNRLSAIIDFAPLSPVVVERVVDKFIGELSDRLKAQKVKLEVTREGAQSGSAGTATIRNSGRVRSAVSSRTRSRARSPTSCCSDAFKKGGTSVVDLRTSTYKDHPHFERANRLPANALSDAPPKRGAENASSI